MSAAVLGGTETNRKTNSVLKEKTEKDTGLIKQLETRPNQYSIVTIEKKQVKVEVYS